MSKWRVDRFEWENSDADPKYLERRLNDLEDKGWDVEGVEFFEYHVVVISTRKEPTPTEPEETESKWKRNPDWKPIGDGRRRSGKYPGRRGGGGINRIG